MLIFEKYSDILNNIIRERAASFCYFAHCAPFDGHFFEIVPKRTKFVLVQRAQVRYNRNRHIVGCCTQDV